ncbi:hypothetical protein BE21_56435 [Sorangium cellulosum]|uniref:Uncharacterized protein n=1 Tax=Sorangium cellulosum TaxID=56 RepID=A0A150TA89_SORCE|nr:hypothetical protein BE21_56435 [Sorangium cellulosum]
MDRRNPLAHAEHADAAEIRPEDQFGDWVRQSVGFVAALLAAVPLLTAFIGVVPPPKYSDLQLDKALPIFITCLSGLVFLSLFWAREQLGTIKAAVSGVLLCFVGVTLLIFALIVSTGGLAVFCYMGGYLLALGGAAAALMSGFVRTRERLDTLAKFIAKLTPEQWSSLTRYARTLVSVREHIEAIDMHPASRKALRKSADNLINEHAKMLVKLEAGTLEIRGPVMDDIFQYFLESVQQSFRAISRDDLAYWTSPDCARYLDANRRLIDEGRAVERIFLLRQNEGLSPVEIDAMARQISLGVRVRIAYLEVCTRLVEHGGDLDFGIFDDFAVSFWRVASDRVFRITTSPADCTFHGQLFAKVSGSCVLVPDKTAGDKKLFESVDELQRWAIAHAAHQSAVARTAERAT